MDISSTLSQPSEKVSWSQSGNVSIRIPQLAPQFQLLPQGESISSIPSFMRWVPPKVANVADTHFSSVRFAEEQNETTLYQDFMTSNFIR